MARRRALQRLFSTFPGGWPGAGILLLRTTVGLMAAREGALYLADSASPFLAKWVLGLALTASGACLAAGLLTPIAGVLVGVCYLGLVFSWFPIPHSEIQEARLMAFETMTAAAALALHGPGAYSLDGRFFGRREIIIPPASRPPAL